MTSWTASLVKVIQHGICDWVIFSVRNENGLGSSSPGWISVFEKSMDLEFNLGGVPVLNRAILIPASFSDPLMPNTADSPARPPEICCSP